MSSPFGPPEPDSDIAQSESFLDELRQELSAEAEVPPVRIPVNSRQGWAAVFSTNLSAQMLRAWQKRFTHKNELDEMKLSTAVLVTQNLWLEKNGVKVLDRMGTPVNFGHPEFLSLMSVSTPADAVQRFYVRDGLMSTTAAKVLGECGYDEEVSTDDPLDGSVV